MTLQPIKGKILPTKETAKAEKDDEGEGRDFSGSLA